MSHYGLGLAGVGSALQAVRGCSASESSSGHAQVTEADDPRKRRDRPSPYRIQRDCSLAAAPWLDALWLHRRYRRTTPRSPGGQACAWIGGRIAGEEPRGRNEIAGEAARVRTFIVPRTVRIAMAVRELMNSGPLPQQPARAFYKHSSCCPGLTIGCWRVSMGRRSTKGKTAALRSLPPTSNPTPPDGRRQAQELRRLHEETVKSCGIRCVTQKKISHRLRGPRRRRQGGTIRAVTEQSGSRMFRVVALPAPTERENRKCTCSATSAPACCVRSRDPRS